LKRERLIFGDPTRGVSLARAQKLPRPLPSDRLRGLIDRAPTPMSAAALALIAVHAVRHTELLRLRLEDLDRASGRLLVCRPGTTCTAASVRTVFLDELTLRMLTEWLHERHRLWPRSTNPHLFVSRRTAMNTDGPPITKFCLTKQFRKVGVLPSRLSADRILHEAAETADPVHLMRVFDISQATAIRYVAAAHPKRFAIDPTQA
jgi:integrase